MKHTNSPKIVTKIGECDAFSSINISYSKPRVTIVSRFTVWFTRIRLTGRNVDLLFYITINTTLLPIVMHMIISTDYYRQS